MRIQTKSGNWWFDIKRSGNILQPLTFEVRQWPENILLSRHRTKEKAVEKATATARRLDRLARQRLGSLPQAGGAK